MLFIMRNFMYDRWHFIIVCKIILSDNASVAVLISAHERDLSFAFANVAGAVIED